MNHIDLLEHIQYQNSKDHKKHDHLQYVFSCLSTHSQWVKKAIHDFTVIEPYFNLSLEDKHFLKMFMDNQGKRMLAASLVMEEKRWREVLLTLKLLIQIIDHTELYKYWLCYLEVSDLSTHIPATPILESIQFINFLLTTCNKNKVITAVLRYEYLKNTALACEFVLEGNSHQINLKHDMNYLSEYKIKINPSVCMEKFDVAIVQIIKDLNYKKYINLFDYTCLTQTENLIFFKNASSGLVKIMCLNEEWYTLLACHASESSHPGCELSNGLSMSDHKNYFHFLKNMHVLNIISITNK